ncbi:hypothetical protein bcCo53_001726 (plasmid) [Borrelia coriaceae]|uniref:Uncharacterized protein n=1 Tax=Borrelia coriaceae ATCC 43381 TaxID=1408429 RepID=W5T256_9SPIR|nr:plasmid maintenance protein [Borrelia coriaceae]AHH11356.1 Hypothetical protein BCO_0124801 [Borrelia coriaceae ATCC 43381]UPA17518.1 hypothetical protein bcCo53_001726 [Borrelia coriaceae]
MSNTKKPINKYQHKLIVLISTLNYANSNLDQYTQSDILYYFNNNIKKNGQEPVKLKTLQNYLYKLEKIFKVTNNYHRHLGVNMGTEIHYELKYNKKACYYIINKHFREKKETRHKDRVNAYLKKLYTKNSSVEKEECYYNTYNKKEEKKNKKFIERLQVKKYAKKCNFKTNAFFTILDLETEKIFKIKALKAIKKAEDNVYNKIKQKNDKLQSKQKKLNRILSNTRTSLKNEGYDNKQLKIQVEKVYEQYKNKPHFIIENNKYNDLEKIISKLKNTVKYVLTDSKGEEKNIRNNIFSILIEQLRHINKSIVVPILKDYLNKQKKLTYNKVFNNYYYYELLKLIENDKDYPEKGKFKKITS